MWEFIWGLKTVAIFDFWTFEHINAGLSIGQIVKKKTKKELQNVNPKVDENYKTAIRFSIVGILFCAYIWEAVEHYLELGLGGEWLKNWFWGVEFWPNRLIFDPLMLIVGYFIVLKYPKLVWPARIISAIWLFVNLVIFPHSMYLNMLMN